MIALLVLVVITGLVAAKGYCPAEENSVDFWSTDTVECIDLTPACKNCIDKCTDSNFSHWMEKNCPKSCSFCKDKEDKEKREILWEKRSSWTKIDGKKAKGKPITKNLKLDAAKEKCETLGEECAGLSCKGTKKCNVMGGVSKTKSDEKYDIYVKEGGEEEQDEEEEEEVTNGCTANKCVQDGSGTFLRNEERLVSKNGDIAFIMQGDGNLVLYCKSVPIWHSATYGKSVNDGLAIQGDKNLVLYGTQRSCSGYTRTVVLWSPNCNGDSYQGKTTLIAQDDRNVVLYNAEGNELWSTGTANHACSS